MSRELTLNCFSLEQVHLVYPSGRVCSGEGLILKVGGCSPLKGEYAATTQLPCAKSADACACVIWFPLTTKNEIRKVYWSDSD